jgi:4-oxalocrotonate tautomerase
MPFIAIKTSGKALGPADIETLHQETTALMAKIMGKKAEVTAVLVEDAPASRWSVGGRALADAGGITAHADIKITQGTNTVQEKAAMIAAMRDMLRRVLPGLSEVAYVVIDEIPATDWGYGGLTQAERKRRADADAA